MFSAFINHQKKVAEKLRNKKQFKKNTKQQNAQALVDQMERYYKQKEPAYDAQNPKHKEALKQSVNKAHIFIIAREIGKRERCATEDEIKALFPKKWIPNDAHYEAQNEETGGTMWAKEDLKAKIVGNIVKLHAENDNDGNDRDWASHYANTFDETIEQMKKDGKIREIYPIGSTEQKLIMIAAKK